MAQAQTWRSQAACRGLDPNIFFPPSDEEAAPAKAVCSTCPVRQACLDWALETRQHDGVWGGMDETERRRERRRRAAARRSSVA